MLINQHVTSCNMVSELWKTDKRHTGNPELKAGCVEFSIMMQPRGQEKECHKKKRGMSKCSLGKQKERGRIQ